MIKKLIYLPIFIILFFTTFNTAYAEDSFVDMSEWRFIQLISNGEHTISKFYSKDDSTKVGFCLEPNEYFNKKLDYSKTLYDDDYIFNVVRAYKEYGVPLEEKETNEYNKYNYYIACQILIWEYVEPDEYIFSKDYSSYKQEILEYIDSFNNTELLSNESEDIYESKINETATLKQDFTEYNINADKGIEIISNDENGLTYKLLDSKLNTIELIPKYNPKEYSYRYSAEGGQDLYCFEGEYKSLQPMTISLLGLNDEPECVSLYYSKKDSDGNNIEGAQFSLYEINPDSSDQDLLLIQTNKELNLYEILLDDYSTYDSLSLEISERYNAYLNGAIINTNEIGYFPYKIYNGDTILKQGICYVFNNSDLLENDYKLLHVKNYMNKYSENKDVNNISNVEKGKTYYLCESEPAKGYVYATNPCYLVDTANYKDEVYSFVNAKRTYTLKLMKQSPYEVLLDGAKFKISYLEDNEYKEVILTTGYLNIPREENNKYLIYKKENINDVQIYEYVDDNFSINNVETGKYYYYQSNSNIIDYSKLNDSYVLVLKGGLAIENMPYSSSLTIEELEAPKGFMITDPIYYISPNISYSEITFRNFRVNQFDILSKKKFKLPKTCIEN